MSNFNRHGPSHPQLSWTGWKESKPAAGRQEHQSIYWRLAGLGAAALVLAAAVAAVPPDASSQIAPLHSERRAIIVDSYRSALGREPSPQELYYWSLYPETPPGVINANSLFAVLLQTLANSSAERRSTAERALSAVFRQEETSKPRLRAYLEDGRNPPLRGAAAELLARREGGGYRGLIAWLARPETRQWFIERTGMALLIAGEAERP